MPINVSDGGGGSDHRPRPNLPDKFDGTKSKFSGFFLINMCNRVFELYPWAYPTGHAQAGHWSLMQLWFGLRIK